MNLPSVFRFTHLPVTSADDKESPVECLGSCAGGDHPAAPGAPIVAALMSFVKRPGRRSPERTLRRRKPRGCQSNLARSNLDGPSDAICNAICNAICKKTRAPLHKRFMALGLLLAGGLTSGLSFAQEVTTITPLSLTKSFATPAILAGETQTMTFTISNPNSRSGNDAFIFGIRFTDNLEDFLPGIEITTDSLPTDRFCSTPTSLSPPNATFSDGLLTVTGAELADGDRCEFEVEFIVPANLAPGVYTNTTSDLDQRTVSNEGNEIGITTPAASATMTIPEPAADLEVTVSDATDPIVAGTNQVYTVTVTNNGPEDAPAVASTFTLPAGTTLVSTAGCAEDTSGVPTCTLGNIAASAAAEYTVTAAVDFSFSPSTITATATAASTGPNAVADDNAANDAGSASTEVLMATENTLTLTKSFGANPIEAGARQTMTFTISNPDDLTASETDRFFDILVQDSLSTFLGSAPGIDTNGITLPTAGFCGSLSVVRVTTNAVTDQVGLQIQGVSLNGGESCTIEVEFIVPSDLAPGVYTNTTSRLLAFDERIGSALELDFPAASATMTVVAAPADLAVTVTDATDPIVPGANQVYTVAVANNGPGDAPDVVSTFTLPAGATLVSTSGCAEDTSGVPTCTLGNIAASTSASYTVTASINAATTSTIIATATAASTGPDAAADNNAANDTGSQDTTVTPSADISITKDDGVTSVNGGGTVTYSIVASNNGPSDDPAVTVADTFPPGLMNCTYTSVAAGGASGNTASGTGNLAETLSLPSGGEVTYTATCTVAVAATGTLSNTATATASVADPDSGNNSATDDDTVVTSVTIGFSKGFSPAIISQGATSTLSFTIDNGANIVQADNMAFSDQLPAGLVVADTPAVTNSCGGTFSPAAGATTLAFTGGTLNQGARCQIQVTVRAIEAGALINPGIDLTSSIATATSNQATLTVNAAADLAVTVTDATDPIVPGANQVYTVAVANSGPGDAPDVVSTFTLPAGATLVSTSGCAEDTSGVPTCTLGNIAASTSAGYTVTASINAATTSTINATATAASTGPNAVADENPANDTGSQDTTVTPSADISITKDDGVTSVNGGGTVTYSIVASNNGPSADPAVAVTDTFPPGLMNCAYTSVATGGASGNSASGTGNLAETLSLPPGGAVTYTATCTVAPAATGTLSNTATATASVADPDSGNNSATDDDTVVTSVTIDFSKGFSPATVDQGATSTLTFTINNGANIVQADNMAFSDQLPAGLEVADTPAVTNTCGGAFSPAAGATTLAFTGGTLNQGATCQIQVTVRAIAAGTLINPGIDLTSSIATATSNPVTLTVNAADVPLFTKHFSPDAITRGEETEIVFTVNNADNAIDLTAMQFTDPLPAGLVVVDNPGVNNSCGGAFSPAAGATTLAFTGGTLDAGAMCEIRVTVRAVVAGTLTNPGIDLTSSVATATSLVATLTVNELLSVTDNMVTVSDADTDIERTASIRPGGMVEPFTELPSTEVFSFPTLSFGLDTSGAFTYDTGSPTGSSSSYRFRAGMVIYDPDDLSGRRLELDIPSVTMTIDNDGAISGEIGPQDFNVWGRTSDTEVAVSVPINTPITFSENTFEFDAATLIGLIQSDGGELGGELGDALSNIRTEGQTFNYLLVLKQEKDSTNLDEPDVVFGSKPDGEFTPFPTEAGARAADRFEGNLANPPRSPLNGLYAGGYRLTGEVRFADPVVPVVPVDPIDPVDPVVPIDPVPGVIATLSRACNFAKTVLSDLNRDIITDAQAIRFLDTLNDSLETAGTAIQAGAEVEMTNVFCILDGIGDIVGALDDSALNPALVNDLQAVTQTTLTLVSDLVADDADPDSTEAVMDSTSYVVNAVLGVDATMEADYKATAQSLVESVLSKALDDIAATLGRDRAAFAFTDAEATRVLLAENTTLLDRVLEVTAISLTGTTPLDGDATRSAIEEAGVSAAGAEALAAELNQFVIPPAFLIEIDGQAVDLLDLLNDALPGFGAATVDSGTGTVAFASDSGATEAFVTAVAIVPDSVPQGVFISPDGSTLIIADCVAISLAPSPADPVEFVRAIELVGGGEFITTIRDNGALALTHAPSGDAINITFPFDVIGSGEPGTMTSFTLPQGNDPVDPEYLIGVTFEDGSTQSLAPMIAAPQFYDLVTALGLEMETDRSTGVITINGYRFKAGYNSWPATSFEILYWNSSADAFGVAYIPTDANGDGVTDFNVVTLINGVLAGQIVYQLP